MYPRDCFPAFVDELTKIGAVAKKKKKPSPLGDRVATGLVGGALASQVPPLVGTAALASMPKREAHLPDVSQSHVNDMAQRMGLKQKVKYVPGAGPNAFHFHHDPTTPGFASDMTGAAAQKMGINVNPKRAQHYVSSNTRAGDAILAHELGHAKNLERWGKGWRYGLAGPSAGISRASLMPTAAWASGQEDPSWTPGLIQAGLAAPNLIEEGAASTRAARMLMKQHGALKGLGKSMPLLPAWASYGAVGLTPMAITAGRKLWRKNHPPAQDGAVQAP